MNLKILKPFDKNIDALPLKISICDQNRDIAEIFAVTFQEIPSIEIAHGNIFNLGSEALVSPANSFGDMSGGIDKAIDDFYKGEAQTLARRHIAEFFLGEIPVGMASIVQMQSILFPYLIIAPTMRVPSNVGKTLNAYLAMRAILVAIHHYNQQSMHKIKSIALPALCTGVGGMSYQESASQMLAAYKNVALGYWQSITHPSLAPFASSVKWNWTKL